jgi:hypothetical protein
MSRWGAEVLATGVMGMIHASNASERQEPAETIEESPQTEEESRQQWVAVSELRERPSAGGHIAFLTYWALRPKEDDQAAAHADEGGSENKTLADTAESVTALPPLALVQTVAARWRRLGEQEDGEQPSLLGFRVAAALSPQEVSAWCPGAAVRLYTLGGPVAPLPDTMLSEDPLSRYSVVQAPTMSFWPELRALIEAQEREQPGMDRWEDLERDLDLLEQELTFWLESPYGLIVNLYEGEDLIGHLSLARQRDETEGCDGWGIIALHVARRVRGQQLSVLLQRVAATLIVSRRRERQFTQALHAIRRVPAREHISVEAAKHTDEERAAEAGDEAPPAQDANPSDAGTAASEAESAVSPEEDQGAPVAHLLEQPWPYLFGFVPPNNIPALRGAYAAGREIIGTYVDVPMAALEGQK